MMNDLMNQSINDGGVCRTVPATLGLLIGYKLKMDLNVFCVKEKLNLFSIMISDLKEEGSE